MTKTPFTLLIHIALAIIVAGALVTHFCGIQGSVSLHDGEYTDCFAPCSGPSDGSFPFMVRLDSAEVIYYPGTTTPMDFKSFLNINGSDVTVAMNRIAVMDGWRFYQSGMGPGTSTLSVSHDPWGIGITYTGYALLGIGLIGFFFQKKTVWRSLLKALKKATPLVILLFISISAHASDTELPTMQRPLARNLGKVYVYWNDRVCPAQTMAIDIASKLYGSRTYKGMTPEQILAGWMFYYDDWIKDYNGSHIRNTDGKDKKEDTERHALIQWMGTGRAFRLFPYKSSTGRMEWLSLTERKPSHISLEQWVFMNNAVTDIKNLLMHGQNRAANMALTSLVNGQRKYAGPYTLPSDGRFHAELFYNGFVRLAPGAAVMLLAGAFGLFLALSHVCSESRRKRMSVMLFLLEFLAVIWLCAVLTLRGWIGGHWPLSNGCETMLFMAFCAAFGSLVCRGLLIRGASMIVAAIATFVAAMSSKTPQIASLTPVLDSPLLTIHVMVVMCSYVLFLLMAVLAAVALLKGGDLERRLARVNAVLLVPAVFLLTAGIFIGAVWANQSWGRYWGWDPKETCALVTMIIYAIPMHRTCIRIRTTVSDGRRIREHTFANPKVLNIYLLCAVLSVIFTYFGANFLIPGLHSYA